LVRAGPGQSGQAGLRAISLRRAFAPPTTTSRSCGGGSEPPPRGMTSARRGRGALTCNDGPPKRGQVTVWQAYAAASTCSTTLQSSTSRQKRDSRTSGGQGSVFRSSSWSVPNWARGGCAFPEGPTATELEAIEGYTRIPGEGPVGRIRRTRTEPGDVCDPVITLAWTARGLRSRAPNGEFAGRVAV